MNRLLFILFFAAANFGLRSQPFTISDPALVTHPVGSMLLQQVPGAFAAWSVRQLNASYSGNCVIIERSSDSATNGYSFVNGVVDTNAILAYAGAGNAYVIAWYDQSGNAANLTASGTNTAPCLVVSGALIVGNHNQPALRYRSGQSLASANQAASGSLTVYSVAARAWTSAAYAPIFEWNYGSTTGAGLVTSGGATSDWSSKQWLAIGNGYGTGRAPRALGSYGAISDNTWHLTDAELVASGSGVWLDSVSIASLADDGSVPAISSSPIFVGGNAGTGDYWTRDISEVVIYNAAHASGTQAAVRANINSAYALY